MRREKRENNKGKENRKIISILGFLASITLLSIAIILSINEQKNDKEAKINKNITNSTSQSNLTQMASSELSKTINEVKNEANQVSMSNNENNNSIQNNILNNNSNENKSSTNNTNSTNNAKSNTNVKEEKPVQQFIKPVNGEITKNFAMDSLIYSDTLQEWITHRGIDIKADKATVVKAASGGTIKSIKEDPRYGLSITIEHEDGFTTVYSSLLSSEFVKEGEKVEQGQSIGTVGNSAVFEVGDGTHLHFEILKNGEYVNPDIYIK